jgi:hypothetical protein
MTELETEYTSDIICPHCGEEYGDSWEYNDDDGETLNCISCGEPFHLSVDFNVSYTTKKLKELKL